MEEIKIKISNLHKSFGKKVVLDGVDLEINKGESLVVIGGSGTGKSGIFLLCGRWQPADSLPHHLQ